MIRRGAQQAGRGQLADRLRLGAAALLQTTPDKITLGGGRATVAETQASVALDEIARVVHHGPVPLTEALGRDLSAFAIYDPAGTFSNACHVAFVVVDIETGAVRIERYVVVEDAGRLINPMIVDGQIAGGVAQGIANALFEEIVYDDDGNILTATLADYLVPTMAEIPPIEIHHLVTLTGASVTQAKASARVARSARRPRS
ncbi:MAG: molybdopterin cofactor-binding domain-containing protein [Pseudomonadota bacterium]